MTEWKAFTVESKDHVAQVTLIGPGKGNAMGPDFWRELPLVFGELDADPEVRAIVLTGSGRNFSYGLDLQAMSPLFGALLADRARPRRAPPFCTTSGGCRPRSPRWPIAASR